jgi:hypothetical protein
MYYQLLWDMYGSHITQPSINGSTRIKTKVSLEAQLKRDKNKHALNSAVSKISMEFLIVRTEKEEFYYLNVQSNVFSFFLSTKDKKEVVLHQQDEMRRELSVASLSAY